MPIGIPCHSRYVPQRPRLGSHDSTDLPGACRKSGVDDDASAAIYLLLGSWQEESKRPREHLVCSAAAAGSSHSAVINVTHYLTAAVSQNPISPPLSSTLPTYSSPTIAYYSTFAAQKPTASTNNRKRTSHCRQTEFNSKSRDSGIETAA